MQVSKVLLGALALFAVGLCSGQTRNIKLVAMSGNQYWFSSSSPYAPQLNFHLAYQYCRTLGLQLVTLETKEEMDLVGSYLKAMDGSAKRDYWTSGNKIGSDTWIWMSSGEQLNSTFDFWLQQKQTPQQPSLGGLGSAQSAHAHREKGCMTMQHHHKRTSFATEDCSKALPFICEQLRCLYYNYPVSPFPNPEATAEIAALRADFEASSSESRHNSRTPLDAHSHDKFRNYLYTLSSSSSSSSSDPKPADIDRPISIGLPQPQAQAQQRRLSYRPPINLVHLEPAPFDFDAEPSGLQPVPYIHAAPSEPAAPSTSSVSTSEDRNETVITTTSTTSNPIFPTTTDINFFTVKQVVVSKSEKVSFANHSNIYGVSIVDRGDAKRPTDIIIVRPSSSSEEAETAPAASEHRTLPSVDGALNANSKEHYEVEQGEETTRSLLASRGPTKPTVVVEEVKRDGAAASSGEQKKQKSVFQFHRSRSPVSWNFNKD